jgi:hypothetical protein
VSNSGSGVKCRQNIPQLAGMFRVYAAWVAMLKKPFQTLVANCPYRAKMQPATCRMSTAISARLLLF